ncbi:MAG: hypothetical protein K8S54_08215 [Spirochaetia bacterium]|nr:hypothetical protein [Spirochaetia bacterium]
MQKGILSLSVSDLARLILGIRLRPLQEGLLASAAALFALFPIEIVRILRSGFFLADVIFAAEIFIVTALIAGLGLQIIFFLIRFLSSLLLRFQDILPGLLPGVAVFFVLQPMAESAVITIFHANIHPGIIWAATLVIGLAIGTPLLFLFPDLRGENSPLVLFAVIAARLVAFVYESGATFEDEAFSLLRVVCLSMAFYFWLQIRRRSFRSPHFSPFFVSGKLRLTLGLISTLLYSGLIVLSLMPVVQAEFVVFVVLFLLIVWQITAVFMVRALHGARMISSGFVGLLLITAIASSFDLYLRYPVAAPSTSARLLNVNSFAGRVILNVGVLLDRDNDGNSSWPGGDPNDFDPCVRHDGLNLCKRTSQVDVASPPNQRFMFITLEGSRKSFPELPAGYSERMIFMASEQADQALAALLLGVDGYSVVHRRPDISLLANISEYGFRTICVDLSNAQFLHSGSPMGLDHGCQVFLRNQKFAEAALAIARYQEKKSAVWMHGDLARLDPAFIQALRHLEKDKLFNLYKPAIILMDPTTQTILLRTPGKVDGPPFENGLLPALYTGLIPPADPVDIRAVPEMQEPAMIKILGLDPRRFFLSIKYKRKESGDGFFRQAQESLSGASWISDAFEAVQQR